MLCNVSIQLELKKILHFEFAKIVPSSFNLAQTRTIKVSSLLESKFCRYNSRFHISTELSRIVDVNPSLFIHLDAFHFLVNFDKRIRPWRLNLNNGMFEKANVKLARNWKLKWHDKHQRDNRQDEKTRETKTWWGIKSVYIFSRFSRGRDCRLNGRYLTKHCLKR